MQLDVSCFVILVIVTWTWSNNYNPLLAEIRYCRDTSARVKQGARSNGIAHSVGSEPSIDKRTPPLPSDSVWW